MDDPDKPVVFTPAPGDPLEVSGAIESATISGADSATVSVEDLDPVEESLGKGAVARVGMTRVAGPVATADAPSSVAEGKSASSTKPATVARGMTRKAATRALPRGEAPAPTYAPPPKTRKAGTRWPN